LFQRSKSDWLKRLTKDLSIHYKSTRQIIIFPSRSPSIFTLAREVMERQIEDEGG